MKSLPLVISFFVGVVVVSLLGLLFFNLAINRANQSGGISPATTIDFVVKSGEKVYEIGQHLEENRLINSVALFKLYVRLKGLSGQLQAGNYKMEKNLSLVEVVDRLRHGNFDVRLTFPEGWRVEQMAEYLDQTFKGQDPNFDPDQFLKQAYPLEGFLFPDTYIVASNIKTEELIETLKSNFERRVDSRLRSDLASQDLTLDQVVILASIVERESSREEDRPVVAGILLKRWRNDWPLEADATVQYVKASQVGRKGEWWPKDLTIDDLALDSPYNTRRHAGLPPRPISNPGLSSLRAVVYALETPYWFYLTDDSGQTHYAKTLEEHNSNIARYLP